MGRGLETAIDAMKLLPDYILWICGDGDVKLELEKRAKGISNIIFFGLQEPVTLKKITQKAKYGLNLLDLKSENYNLSLANKFFDYAASGVVSINSPGLEYIDYQYKYNNCCVLNELESQELSELIMDTSDQSFLEMQKNGYILLEENNWEIESHKLINYLKE
jgi:glycosyltransferase involved in cell wall biosynthesis